MMSYDDDVTGVAGDATQVKACTARLRAMAHDTGCVVILVCHVNKDGDMNGPKTLMHLVDAIFKFEMHESARRSAPSAPTGRTATATS